jgi:hypothetical protein
MSLYEIKTGKFLGLNGEQLGRLNGEQIAAYNALAAEHIALDAANLEAESAITANRAAVSALHAAEAAAAKRPKYTFLDELRASQAQWRADHR